MRTGTPRMRTRSSPCPYAYGDPHMHTAIPICILSHMGIKSLISHMRTNPVCIRLVTEQSPYAYGDCHYDRIHTGICLQSITIRVRGFQSSPYAYGDCYYNHTYVPRCALLSIRDSGASVKTDHRMHTGRPRTHTGRDCYEFAYGESQYA